MLEEDTGSASDSSLDSSALPKPAVLTVPASTSACNLLCYCGRGRELGTVEWQCCRCTRWVHAKCLKEIKGSRFVPFMVNYLFVCRDCVPGGHETMTQKQSNFAQMCVTAIANLTLAQLRNNNSKTLFSRDKDIIPYVDANWEKLTSMPRRIKQTWHQTIHKAMAKETEIFYHTVVDDSRNKSQTDDLFGLVEEELSRIGPVQDPTMRMKAASQSGNFFPSHPGGVAGASDLPSSSACSSKPSVSGANGAQGCLSGSSSGSNLAANGSAGIPTISKSKKRKTDSVGGNSAKKSKSDSVSSKLNMGFPVDHPFNKDGYRYYLAENDVHAPNRQEFDDSNAYAGKPIPGYLCRVIRPGRVLLSPHDKAPQLKLSDDHLSVSGEKGYSVVRATHFVTRGSWYWEATIVDQPEGSHARIGWSQPLAFLQAPSGYDKFSYAWRSRKGTKFHNSIGKHFSSSGYTKGDILGLEISLPDRAPDGSFNLPATCKEMPLVKFKSHLYYEEKDEVQRESKNLKPWSGSKISFYKNGVHQGVAYEDISFGNYFPAVSLYKNITVNVNFGPDVTKLPPGSRPMSDRVEQMHIDQCVSELLFYVENDGKLTLDNV